MSLSVIGKISMQSPECIKCGENIKLYARSNILRCESCGAFYEMQTQNLGDQHVEFTYDFKSYKCMNKVIFEKDKCEEECPAPHMYCLNHLTDEHFTQARSGITYAEQRVEEAKDKVQRMEEAKKTWLIKEVSGIDDQDHTVSDD